MEKADTITKKYVKNPIVFADAFNQFYTMEIRDRRCNFNVQKLGSVFDRHNKTDCGDVPFI